MLANDPPLNANTSSRLVLLSLLDATLPVLHSVVAPHAIESLCVEPRSGRIFASRSPASAVATSTAAAAAAAAIVGPAVGAPGGSTGVGAGGATGARAAAAGGAWGPLSTTSVSTGRPGSGEYDVAGAAAWSGLSSAAAAAAAASSGGERMAAAEGAVSVLALASGSFLDRGPLRSVLVLFFYRFG